MQRDIDKAKQENGNQIRLLRRGFALSRSRPVGFTLLELVLVLVMICIVLGEAAPELRGFLIGSRLKNATTDLISATAWARTQAISEGRTYRLMVSATSFQVYYQDGQTFVASQSAMGKQVTLPQDVRMSLTRQDNGMGDHIDFFADGTTEPGTFTIVQTNNGQEQVICESLTERFHLANGGAR